MQRRAVGRCRRGGGAAVAENSGNAAESAAAPCTLVEKTTQTHHPVDSKIKFRNGTQQIFEADDRLLFISIHQVI